RREPELLARPPGSPKRKLHLRPPAPGESGRARPRPDEGPPGGAGPPALLPWHKRGAAPARSRGAGKLATKPAWAQMLARGSPPGRGLRGGQHLLQPASRSLRRLFQIRPRPPGETGSDGANELEN